MRDTKEFFEEQARQCNDRAVAAANRADREFWCQLAHRWEELVRARQQEELVCARQEEHSEPEPIPVRKYGWGRTRFTRRRAA